MIESVSGRLSLGMALAIATVSSAVAGAGGPDGGGMAHNVPEPASFAVLSAGVAVVLMVRKRLRRK